ncbi:hypothetical protein Tco_0732129, partial [Tanacetum coccineum]
HAHLVDTDTESDPEEDPLEVEESQPLGSRVPLVSEEFEAFEPLGTRTDSSYSSASSDSTTPLSHDHPLTHVSPTPTPTRASFHRRIACMTVHAQPAISPGHSARVAEAMALSDLAFHKRYRSSYETSSSPSLPVRKRYKGTFKLILDTDSDGDELGDEDTDEDTNEDAEDESLGADDKRERSDDEDHGLDDEGRGLEGERLDLKGGRLHLRVDPEDDRVYTDIPIYPRVVPIQTPPSPEWSSGSFPISPSSLVVPSPIASPVATPTATISVDEDQFLEVGAQLELHGSILHDHTQRLDALPPTLIADIDRDVRELYTRSGVVRDEIFSQRPVLALEAWAVQNDDHRAALWHAIYDTQRENHDLRMQLAEERRERLELADRFAKMERRQESREE